MGGAIKGAVQPMTGLNPKMGSVVVAGRVFFSDLYETRRPGVFCLTFDMTDFQTSVRVTKYMQKEEKAALKKDIKPGHVAEGPGLHQAQPGTAATSCWIPGTSPPTPTRCGWTPPR